MNAYGVFDSNGTRVGCVFADEVETGWESLHGTLVQSIFKVKGLIVSILWNDAASWRLEP